MVEWKYIKVLIMMLMAWSILHAQDEILIRNTAIKNATLAIPRTKMVVNPDNFNELWFIVGTEDNRNIFFSKDGGNTWGNFPSYNMDYHCQLRIDSAKNLHITAPGRDSQIYFQIKYPADNADLVSPLENLVSGPSSNNYRGTILVESKNVWVYTRLTNFLDQNVRYHLSRDLGNSWDIGSNDTGFIRTNAGEIRIGSILFNGLPTLIVYIFSSEFRYYQWNGKTYITYADSVIAKESAEKIFTFNTFRDGRELHLVFQPSTNVDYLVHKWKVFDSGKTTDWNRKIISIGSTTFRSSPYLVRSDNALFLFYTSGDGQIYMRVWDGSKWGAPVQITSNQDENLYSNSVEYIYPSMNYIPLIWTRSSGSIWFKKINLSLNDIDQFSQIPTRYFITDIAPNPFNRSIKISLKVLQKGNYEISLYNIEGRFVGLLYRGNLNPGEHVFKLNAENFPGMYQSGIYFVTVKVKGIKKSYKIVYVK